MNTFNLGALLQKKGQHKFILPHISRGSLFSGPLSSLSSPLPSWLQLCLGVHSRSSSLTILKEPLCIFRFFPFFPPGSRALWVTACTRWPRRWMAGPLRRGKEYLGKERSFPRDTNHLWAIRASLSAQMLYLASGSPCLTSNQSFQKNIIEKILVVVVVLFYNKKVKKIWCGNIRLKVCCNPKGLIGFCTAPVAKLQQCTCTCSLWPLTLNSCPCPLWDPRRAEHMLHVCAAAWDNQEYVGFFGYHVPLGRPQVWALVLLRPTGKTPPQRVCIRQSSVTANVTAHYVSC